ncbi:corrinoid adenosyltransferase MMAB isoform X1 [Neodiprion pinetum]|uniref:corrinoid adenosyltransferase MMAB isoform X1 n=1 Tax=Neodiprion pinetum TaxID=441929 RepID=UPI001EDCA573|nr:corrinoid adenosyltransferase-like isoform X1 [Neodiprion pinetum]
MDAIRIALRRSNIIYKATVQASSRNCSRSRSQNTRVMSSVSQEALFSRDGITGHGFIDTNDTKPKDDQIFNALGATDELSSYIGLAREFACDSNVQHPYVDKLKRVQMILFDLNHAISRSSPGRTKPFEAKHTKDLEEWIVEYATQLPPAEDYIIPGGGKACASLHVARTICKRAERSVAPLVRDGALDGEAQVYLNRLSDFLLTISRIAAKCDERTENIYIPRAEVSEEKQ